MILVKVENISEYDGISYYEFKAKENLSLFMLSLTDVNLAKVGDDVLVGFKNSDVIISKQKLQNCSLKNEIPCKIHHIKQGKLICVIGLKFDEFLFESIITTNSTNNLNLANGDDVYAYVKSTSLYVIKD